MLWFSFGATDRVEYSKDERQTEPDSLFILPLARIGRLSAVALLIK